MADFSKDFIVAYDEGADSCAIRFRCFDTPNAVTVHDASSLEDVEAVLLEARRTCLQLHRLWSFSLQDSDISAINAPVRSAMVDPRTVMLLTAMKTFHEDEPLFDFTIGPASYLWKHADQLPSEYEIARAMDQVGASKVSLSGCMVEKAGEGVRVDVGGAAKGFAADAVVAGLRSAGVKSADVDLGGNLFMMGNHPSGRPWRVAVRVPEGIEAERVVLEVADSSVVTSGSYERFVEIDGKRYQHIVDPTTGWPSESDIVSATVVSPSSLMADMLATTTLLVGSDGFADLARRHPQCRFVAIASDGRVLRSW